MTTSSTNHLPPNLIANLQNVLVGRKGSGGGGEEEKLVSDDKNEGFPPEEEEGKGKPVVLVTNCNGIRSPGLGFLVQALVRDGRCHVHVCAPDS